jgi:hypothetical protein
MLDGGDEDADEMKPDDCDRQIVLQPLTPR